MKSVRAVVESADPLTAAGLASYLRTRPEITLQTGGRDADTDVVVLATDRLTPDIISTMRQAAAQHPVPVVLITAGITEAELLTIVECRVTVILARRHATGERLLEAVLTAASGGAVMPPALLGELLMHVQWLQREVFSQHGLTASGLTSREVDVLRLLADGHDTAEIATELCYSERTVKNIIHGVTNRLNLKNRPHAVAYALRSGMI